MCFGDVGAARPPGSHAANAGRHGAPGPSRPWGFALVLFSMIGVHLVAHSVHGLSRRRFPNEMNLSVFGITHRPAELRERASPRRPMFPPFSIACTRSSPRRSGTALDL